MTKEQLKDIVRQVYFYCENKDKDGLYPDEVDLVEFSAKLLAVIEAKSKSQLPD